MVLFKGKRGMTHQQMVIIAEFVLPVIILLILLGWVNDITTNKSFDKNYVIRDTALLTSVIYSSPANLFYNNTLNQYVFDFTDNEIRVGLKDDKFPVYYRNRKNNNVFFAGGEDIETKDSLYFLKSGNEIEVGTDLEINLDKLTCPATESGEIYSLGIDPFEIRGIDNFSLKVSKSLVENLRVSIPDTIVTREEGVVRDVNELENVQTIVGIRAGNYDSNKNYLKAYYSLSSLRNMESKKLACVLVNKILDNLEFNGVAVIGINPADFGELSQEKILDNDKVGVIVEIGNVNNKQGLAILKDYSKIAKSMSDGIKEYED